MELRLALAEAGDRWHWKNRACCAWRTATSTGSSCGARGAGDFAPTCCGRVKKMAVSASAQQRLAQMRAPISAPCTRRDFPAQRGRAGAGGGVPPGGSRGVRAAVPACVTKRIGLRSGARGAGTGRRPVPRSAGRSLTAFDELKTHLSSGLRIGAAQQDAGVGR